MTPSIEPQGDAAFLVRLGDDMGADTAARALGCIDALGVDRPPWVVDVVPAYATVLVGYEPLVVEPEDVRAWIADRLGRAAPRLAAGRLVEVPVLYDAAVAPDLEPLASDKGLTREDVVRLHSLPTYDVRMLGFRPGFPFLAGLDPRLATPRLDTPRTSVPAGSVAIGGAQTGVYPRRSPGGWRIIGRTPLRLFDPTRGSPALLAIGDRVRFVPVSRSTFESEGGCLDAD